MFVDSVFIELISGNGGAGAVSFRREKYIPKGGPDGGDGGKGGDIIFKINRNLSSLAHLYAKKSIYAKNGFNGKSRKSHGADGKDAVIEIPEGTVVKDIEGNLIFDLDIKNESFIFLKGGAGGKGNINFSNSVNQKPEYAQPGIPGQSVEVILELKLIADVALVGYPNAGKSTFISVVTNAKPKIGSYPFTTLSPHLGIMSIDPSTYITIADIPGILEGAHKGKGLGLEFLRHIERTLVLFFIIDITSDDLHQSFLNLKNEIEQYSKNIFKEKDFLIGLSKTDQVDEKYQSEAKKKFPLKIREKIYPFSAITKNNLKTVSYALTKIVNKYSKE